jgi:hypothetical protein
MRPGYVSSVKEPQTFKIYPTMTTGYQAATTVKRRRAGAGGTDGLRHHPLQFVCRRWHPRQLDRLPKSDISLENSLVAAAEQADASQYKTSVLAPRR